MIKAQLSRPPKLVSCINKFKSTVGNLQIDVSDVSYRAIVDGLVKHDGPDIFLSFSREKCDFFCVLVNCLCEKGEE